MKQTPAVYVGGEGGTCFVDFEFEPILTASTSNTLITNKTDLIVNPPPSLSGVQILQVSISEEY